MAGPSAITELKACPKCSTPGYHLDVGAWERDDSVVVEVSCPMCGYEASQMVVYPSFRDAWEDVREIESCITGRAS
jgi:hypothetical protein